MSRRPAVLSARGKGRRPPARELLACLALVLLAGCATGGPPSRSLLRGHRSRALAPPVSAEARPLRTPPATPAPAPAAAQPTPVPFDGGAIGD